MPQLTFRDLSFEKPSEGKIKVNFLKMFYFYVDESVLEKIAPFEIQGRNTISFEGISENNARNKFNFLLANSFKSLKNRMTNKATYYIHKSSGIPLIGANYFGLVDRGSNIIEVKPITSCNIGCIFCSVDEGPLSRRKTDYVIEKDYLVEEFRKIVEFKTKAKAEGISSKDKFSKAKVSSIRLKFSTKTDKAKQGDAPYGSAASELTQRKSLKLLTENKALSSQAVPHGEAAQLEEDSSEQLSYAQFAPSDETEQAELMAAEDNIGFEDTNRSDAGQENSNSSPNIDAHINAQGEPLLYAEMVELVRDIMEIPGVKTSSIDTNGLLLTKQMVDELAEAGLSRINLSLHAMEQEKATQLAGAHYNLKKVLEIARYIPTTKMDLIIVPVWMKGYNDDELPKLAKFAVEIGAGKHCPPIGIQNLMNYRFGRNPIDEVPLEEFYAKMRELEKEHGIKIIFDKYAFHIEDLPELPKPFKKGQIVEADIVLPGRIGSEKLAVAKGRLISVPGCHYDIGRKVRLKIKRTKHNIFLGELLN